MPARHETTLATTARLGRDLVWTLLGLVAIGAVLSFMSAVVVPIVLALFLTALLLPLNARFLRRGASPTLAALGALLVGIAVLVALVLLAVVPLVRQLGTALDEAANGVGELAAFADRHDVLTTAQAGDAKSFILRAATTVGDVLLQGLVTGFATVATIGTTVFLTLPLVFFLLRDGAGIWERRMAGVASANRDRIDRAGRAAIGVLAAFLRGAAIVALFDSVVVGIGLTLIGVPFAFPLAVLTFGLAFIPLMGAILAGTIATLVALAAGGVTDALLVVALSLVVNQLEGVLVSPFAIGRAVSLHPALVLLTVTAGASIAGITGAFVAVPVLAVATAVAREWRRQQPAAPVVDGA